MKPKYILFTTNEAYAQHCAVSIRSIIENNPDTQFKVVVASLNLSNASKENLKNMASSSTKLTINIIDFDEKSLDRVPQIGSYSKDIYIRLWVDEFFSDKPDKVLYIDADTIVVDQLDDLWNIDLSNNILAAVDIPNAATHKRLSLPEGINYFNSGVIMFNMPQWRQNDCLSVLINYINKYKAILKNPDQDALNACFYKKRLTLNYTYNCITPFFKHKNTLNLPKEKLKRIQNSVVIVHFNGNARPWFFSCAHPYQQRYFQYLNLTPWADFEPKDKNIFTLCKKYLRRIIGIENFVTMKKLKGK